MREKQSKKASNQGSHSTHSWRFTNYQHWTWPPRSTPSSRGQANKQWLVCIGSSRPKCPKTWCLLPPQTCGVIAWRVVVVVATRVVRCHMRPFYGLTILLLGMRVSSVLVVMLGVECRARSMAGLHWMSSWMLIVLTSPWWANAVGVSQSLLYTIQWLRPPQW